MVISPEELRPYMGKWVAVRGNYVVMSGESAREAVEYLTNIGPGTGETTTIFRVPENPREDRHK